MKKSMSKKFVASLFSFVMALTLISFWGSNQVEAAPKKKAKVSKENIKAHKAYEKFIKGLKGGKSLLIFEDAKLKKLYFAYHDMDKDKIDELLLKVSYITDYERADYFVFQVQKSNVKKVYEFNDMGGTITTSAKFGFDRNGIYEYYSSMNYGGVEVSVLKKGKIKGIYSGDYSWIDNNGKLLEETQEKDNYTTKGYKKILEDPTFITFIPVNKKNLKKYRNTYNSTDFKEYIE